MQAALERVGGHLDGIFFCPHAPKEHCDCRKPLPGLFRQISERYGVSMQGVPAIGDSVRDIEAARAVGARPILVRSGRGASALQRLPDRSGVEIYADLAAAARQLIGELA
jgi:D-glycero-D-manno-heptose 1,7-bisphosphate phosphatase